MTDTAVSTINERAAEEYFKRGQEAESNGLAEKALEFYERTLAENSDHELACFRLAVLYDRQADDAKAIELYERICTTAPVHVNALMNLAILFEDNNHYEEAFRCLDAVLRTDPNHERARLFMKDVESARASYVADGMSKTGGAVLDTPITDFDLSVRSRNCLKKMNIRTLGDLLRTTEPELLAYRNFGEMSLNEIKNLLAGKGLRLGQIAPLVPAIVEGEMPAPAFTGGGAGGMGGMGAMMPVSAAIRPAVINQPVGLPPELSGKMVVDLELSVRSRKALQRLNINTVGELVSRSEEDLLGCKNFGLTSLNEIKQQIGQFGLTLRKSGH